jgi:EAL domain-containing protein (putative c-di-GMP-specific phosphodiesterase class I)
MQRADVAMYVAKEMRSGCHVYTAESDRHSPSRLALGADLRRAIDQGQLFLHYQPQVSLPGRATETVEALVRWQHPERGLIAPSEFIPLAEGSGLIRPLTLCVLDQALSQCRTWEVAGTTLKVAVNLSVLNLLDEKLPEDVARLLNKWGVLPSSLELEITESTIMSDPERGLSVLEKLNAMGVGLAIDDYGTGHSSLAYLRRLPVREVKIDRAFVTHMDSSESDATIVRSTIELGHNLGLRVVAEGVETAEVLTELTRLGCDLAQGYFISPPLTAEELARWLRRGTRLAPPLHRA